MSMLAKLIESAGQEEREPGGAEEGATVGERSRGALGAKTRAHIATWRFTDLGTGMNQWSWQTTVQGFLLGEVEPARAPVQLGMGGQDRGVNLNGESTQ